MHLKVGQIVVLQSNGEYHFDWSETLASHGGIDRTSHGWFGSWVGAPTL